MPVFIAQESLDFLNNLEKNNQRDWFNTHKDCFLVAQQNFAEFVDTIIEGVAQFDASVEKLEAKNCLFRIYRDTRFSKDKTPYKTHFGASLVAKGNKTLNHAGYYIQLDAEKAFVAGGVYKTEPQNMKAIRQEISSNTEEFLGIITKKSFIEKLTFEGDKLVKIPQGFDKQDQMGDYLKYKQFTVFHHFTKTEISDENFAAKIITIFKEIHPFNQFINQAIDALE